jgi:acetyl esterase/lipase
MLSSMTFFSRFQLPLAFATLVVLSGPSLAIAQAAGVTPTEDAPPQGYASVEPLWPNGAPGAVGTAPVDIPKIYSYPASGPGPHAAVVVLPGGGYTHVVMEKEGGAPARWLNAHGVSAYVVQYRVSPRYMYPYPLNDGLRAMRYVRAHAREWQIRPDAIGVWGFSAGGHMAGWLSTLDAAGKTSAADLIDQVSGHPDFAVLSYARVDLDSKIPGTFGMTALTGPGASEEAVDAIDPIKHVSAATSPAFIYATEKDEKVNSLNASHYFEALQEAGVPVELHIFQLGPHGTGLAQSIPDAPELAIWPTLLQHWLQLHGWMPMEP